MDKVQKLDLDTVQQKVEKIYTFLVPCLPLANAHATDFITKQYWDTLLPEGIRKQLLNLSKQELGSLPCAVLEKTVIPDREDGESKMKEQNLYTEEFLNSRKEMDVNHAELSKVNTSERKQYSNKLCISSDCFKEGASNSDESQIPYNNIDDFLQDACLCTIESTKLAMSPHDLLSGIGGTREEVFIGTYMNQKKCHEVDIMSKICASLARCLDCQMIVDFGSGKGYLGNHLSLQYQLPVLGIDAASTNTQSAQKRNTVLDKQWTSLARNKLLESDGKKLTKKQKKNLKLKGKSAGNGENELEKEQETSDVNEANKDENNVLERRKMIETNSDFTENAFDLSRMSLNETDNVSNICKFIPCTTFIDKETNFINLAKINFPDIFKEHLKDEKLTENPFNQRHHSSETTAKRNLSVATAVSCNLCNKDGRFSDNGSDSTYRKHCVCIKTTTNMVSHDETKYANAGKSIEDVGGISNLNDDNTANSDKADVDKIDVRKTVDINKAHMGNAADKRAYADDIVTHTKGVNVSRTDVKGAGVSNADNGKADINEGFRMMLIGLHTCGDLASTSMEVFTHSDQLKVLCNVGCCYHLIHEQYLNDEDSNSFVGGFPLSRFLKARQFSLGNTARNLASQSIHRISDFDKLQGERFFPRALLEVLIQDVCGGNIEMKGLRKLEQKCRTTQEYLSKACDKLGISDKVSDDLIESYIRKYHDDQHKLGAFFQLKTVLAPCIESLIILDRVCFLLEQEQIKNVFLVKMFDPVKSPRCYGIIAIK